MLSLFLCKYYVEHKYIFFCIHTSVYTGIANNRENLQKYKLAEAFFSVGANFGLSIILSGIFPFSPKTLMGKWSLIVRPYVVVIDAGYYILCPPREGLVLSSTGLINDGFESRAQFSRCRRFFQTFALITKEPQSYGQWK